MIALEIRVDGTLRTTAPVSGMSLMIAGVHTGSRLAEEPKPGHPKRFEDYLELNVRGLTEEEHQSWVSLLPLEIGSDVSIRIVEVASADPPAECSPRDQHQ